MSKRSGYSTTYFAQRRQATRATGGGPGSGSANGPGPGPGYTPGGLPSRGISGVVAPPAARPLNDMARPVTDDSLDSTNMAGGLTPTGGSTNGHPGGPLKPPPGAGTPPLNPNSGPAPLILPNAPTVNPRTGRPFRNPDDATKIQLNGAAAFSPAWDANDTTHANLVNQRFNSLGEGLQALSKALGSQVNIAIIENNNNYRTKPPTGPSADGLFNSATRDVTFTRDVGRRLERAFKNGFHSQGDKYALHVANHEFTHAKDPMMNNAAAWMGRFDEAKQGAQFQLLVEGTCEYRARQLTIKQFGRHGKPQFGAYKDLSDGIRLYTRLGGTNSFESLWAETTLNKRIKHFETNLESSLRTQVEPTLGKVPTDAMMHTLRPKMTKFITDSGVQRQVNAFLDSNDQAGLGRYLQGIAPKL